MLISIILPRKGRWRIPKHIPIPRNDQAEYSHSNHNKAKVICLLSLRSRLIIYWTVELIEACRPVAYTYLFFFQRYYIWHQRYLLMEVPYVKHLIINQLIDSPQLGRRKLPGKQVEHCGRNIFHIMAYMHQCILQNLEMVERQAFHLRHRCPASIVFIRQLFEPSVNLHQCQIGRASCRERV